MSWHWELISGNCPGCGICFDVCPVEAIAMTRAMEYPEPIADECTGCMKCAEECPFDAIKIRQAQDEKV